MVYSGPLDNSKDYMTAGDSEEMFLYYYLVAAVGFKKSLLEKEQPLDIIYERLFIGPDI